MFEFDLRIIFKCTFYIHTEFVRFLFQSPVVTFAFVRKYRMVDIRLVLDFWLQSNGLVNALALWFRAKMG